MRLTSATLMTCIRIQTVERGEGRQVVGHGRSPQATSNRDFLENFYGTGQVIHLYSVYAMKEIVVY